MGKLGKIVLAAAALGVAFTSPAAAQQNPSPPATEQSALVQFPGSGWWLAPPPGFALSTTPPVALRHPVGAEIVLVEFARQSLSRASFGQVGDVSAAGTPDEGKLLSVEAVTAGGKPAFLASARMTKRSATAYNLFVEGNRNNVAVVVTIPDTATGIDPATIRTALLTVTDRPAQAAQSGGPPQNPQIIEQRLAALPFRLNERAGMRIVNVAETGVVTLTEGLGDLMDEAIDQPFVVISRYPMTAGQRFDATRELPKLLALVRERYAGARILSQKVEPSPEGPVATIVFLHTPPGKTTAVAIVAWALAKGRDPLLVFGQFPPERSDLPARFIRVRAGVVPR